MKPLRRRNRGFSCIAVMALGAVVFLLLAGIVNTFLHTHTLNRQRLRVLQQECLELPPITSGPLKPN